MAAPKKYGDDLRAAVHELINENGRAATELETWDIRTKPQAQSQQSPQHRQSGLWSHSSPRALYLWGTDLCSLP
jgi:hypothetical protein